MAKFMNFYVLLSLVSLFTSAIYAKSIETIKEKYDEVYPLYKDKKWGGKREKLTTNDDGYYMVFVNTTVTKKDHHKRSSVKEEDIIISVIDEIRSLIYDNKDTFEDLTQFEAIENSENDLKKRDNSKYLVDYGDSNLVYPISSNNGQTVLYAYLSDVLVDKVENLPKVTSCEQNYIFHYDTRFQVSDIKSHTKWNDVGVRYDTDLHLSLLSQGKYSENLVHHYDTNYYFPKSGGEGINMIFMDSGFNFNNGEFSNTNQRSVQCAFNVTNAKIAPVSDEKYCHAYYPNDHGSRVSDCGAGVEHGVASKANIFGVLFNELNSANIIAAFQYIKDNLIVPHKTVINCSFGELFPKNFNNEAMNHVESLVNEINAMGGVIVVSAGNDGINVNDDFNNYIYFPCAFENTICVGGIDNYDLESVNFDYGSYYRTNVLSSSNAYKKFQYSNYGKNVDIYAPFFVRVSFLDSYYNYMDGIDGGTSYSSPLVAGIAATIMSEYPEMKFNTKKMRDYLVSIGEKNIISRVGDGFPNVFVNNGKHIVYSNDDLYNGCGVRAGNKKCPENQCCSINSQCTEDTTICAK